MSADEQRLVAARSRSRQLALRLAERADDIAATLESAAAVHESIAATEGHPLQDGAADHAARERRLAADERQEARRLRGTSDE